MKTFDFLFGAKKERKDAPIGEKVRYSAKKRLEGNIIRNPFNVWWFVLIRTYIIMPIIKLPLLPISEALAVRRMLSLFLRAREILLNDGRDLSVSWRAQGKSPWVRIIRSVKAALWRPVGHPLAAEKALCDKLLAATMLLWVSSLVLYVLSCYTGYNEGFDRIFKDVQNIFLTSSPVSALKLAKSLGFKLWSLSVFFWLLSLVTAYLLSSRRFIRLTTKVKSFLLSSGHFKTDEVQTRMDILATSEFIFVSSPSTTKSKFRAIDTGWPEDFRPGVILENIHVPSEIVIERRPDREALVFGGEYTRADILSHAKAYEGKLLKPVVESVKAPGDQELLFMGEVLDPNWWRNSKIYVGLGTNPHLAVAGATRSGKTKTVLSFVYSFARSFPDTKFYFADGKGSPDYDPFADYLSEYPVAKPDKNTGDSLIQLANIIEAVWTEFARRMILFDEAKQRGFPCSTIYDYRSLVGPMPQIWLIIDEFASFNNDLEFETHYQTDGTLANRIRRLAAQSASFGIHLLIASQRYQNTDFPTPLRDNLPMQLIHNVTRNSAKFIGTDEVISLSPGQYILRAAGLFCEHTGLSQVKCKLPFIGDGSRPLDLLKKTITPIDQKKRKEFDFQLVYNKGSDDFEKMTVPQLCVRLSRFFFDQRYVVKKLEEDLEATDIQMEIVKGQRYEVDGEDGRRITKLKPLPGAKKFGICVLRPDSVDEETLTGIQDKAVSLKYTAILVYVLGKGVVSTKYGVVKKLNEKKGCRFYIVPFREYYKDLRFIEMKRKVGEYVDIVRPKLERLGINDVSHALAGKEMDLSIFSQKTPVRIKISKYLELMNLADNQREEETRGIPVVKTVLPGGTELNFLINPGKNEREDTKELAIDLSFAKKAVVIVSTEKFTATDFKQLSGKGIQVWRSSQLDERLKASDGANDEIRKRLLSELMQSLQLIDVNDFVKISPDADLTISATVSKDFEKITRCELMCASTGYVLYITGDFHVRRYQINVLKIPETAKIRVTGGVAPMGADPKRVSVEPGAKITSFPESSAWEVDGAVLKRKTAKIAKDDPMLLEMRDQ